MKKPAFIIVLFAGFAFQSCEVENLGDNYDFSNSLPPYVTLTNTDTLAAEPGESVDVGFSMRTSLQQPVTVTYKVEGAVDVPSATVTIARNATSANATIPIPADAVVAPATSAEIKLTMLTAVKADGTSLTVGQRNYPKDRVVVVIVEP